MIRRMWVYAIEMVGVVWVMMEELVMMEVMELL